MAEGPPAAVMEADTEDHFLSVKARTQLNGMRPLTLSTTPSLKDVTSSSNAEIWTTQLQHDLSMPTQEAAIISSKDTNKFASLT